MCGIFNCHEVPVCVSVVARYLQSVKVSYGSTPNHWTALVLRPLSGTKLCTRWDVQGWSAWISHSFCLLYLCSVALVDNACGMQSNSVSPTTYPSRSLPILLPLRHGRPLCIDWFRMSSSWRPILTTLLSFWKQMKCFCLRGLLFWWASFLLTVALSARVGRGHTSSMHMDTRRHCQHLSTLPFHLFTST